MNEYHRLLFLFQVHPLQRKTVQMPGVRQRFLPIQNISSPQDPPHGRIPAQVPGLFQIIQPAIQPENSPSNAHRHQTVQLLRVRQSLQEKLRPQEAQPHA